MKRAELKQILEKISPESRRFYRLSPTLYRDLVLWEDYLQCIECEKTFYSIRDVLSYLCDDVN